MLLNLPANLRDFTETFMLALAIWREARGESPEAKRAVGWVIRNRVQRGGWFGTDYGAVILKPAQFTCFTAGNPNAVRFPRFSDDSWRDSVEAAIDVLESIGGDPTMGATHYYDRRMDENPPAWAEHLAMTADIGAFHFFRQA